MTIDEVKAKHYHGGIGYGSDDDNMIDWLISEYDRLTAVNKVMGKALEKLTTADACAYVKLEDPDEYITSIGEWAEEILDK